MIFKCGAGQGAFGVIKHTHVGRERLKAAGNTDAVVSSVARSVEISPDLAIFGACLATNFRVRD